MKESRESETLVSTLAPTLVTLTTPAGTALLRPSTLEMLNVSCRQRKYFLRMITPECGYRRDPMLNKTKNTNEKMLMTKTRTKGLGYSAPEKLSKNIQTNVREKKDRDSDIRVSLTA